MPLVNLLNHLIIQIIPAIMKIVYQSSSLHVLSCYTDEVDSLQGNCRKLLDSWTVATHSGELFCRNCHNRLFSVTSVRTALPAPRISHILPPVDKADPAALSPCDSLSDCCCCCCCNEDPLLIDPQNQDFEIFGSSASIHEKHRLRGGRDEEPREPEQISETGAGKRSSGSETSKLGARSSVDIIDEPPSSTTAAAPWYNRQQSASQRFALNSNWLIR